MIFPLTEKRLSFHQKDSHNTIGLKISVVLLSARQSLTRKRQGRFDGRAAWEKTENVFSRQPRSSAAPMREEEREANIECSYHIDAGNRETAYNLPELAHYCQKNDSSSFNRTGVSSPEDTRK